MKKLCGLLMLLLMLVAPAALADGAHGRSGPISARP